MPPAGWRTSPPSRTAGNTTSPPSRPCRPAPRSGCRRQPRSPRSEAPSRPPPQHPDCQPTAPPRSMTRRAARTPTARIQHDLRPPNWPETDGLGDRGITFALRPHEELRIALLPIDGTPRCPSVQLCTSTVRSRHPRRLARRARGHERARRRGVRPSRAGRRTPGRCRRGRGKRCQSHTARP